MKLNCPQKNYSIQELNKLAKKYAKEVWKKKKCVKNAYGNKKKLEETAMVCVCFDGNYLGYGEAKYALASYYDYTKDLKDALCNIPPENKKIGQKNSMCNYIIGRCAEPHAARQALMKNRKRHPALANLIFSRALRPRTKQCFDACYNCKNVFPFF